MKQRSDLNDSSPRSSGPRHLCDDAERDLAEYARDVNDTTFLLNIIALIDIVVVHHRSTR
jgi:hypothetical protein